MTRKRWLLLGLLTLGLVAAVLIVLALLPPPPGVTKENFDRIQEGMTRAEVEAILGGLEYDNLPFAAWGVPDEWQNDFGDIVSIHFVDDRVTTKHWDGWPDERDVWQKMLERWPWHAREKHVRERFMVVD